MSPSFKFKPALLSMAVAGAITGSAIAVAQEQVVEEVVVTGIRASLMRAQAVKMDSSSIVEAISAEDIGKLPDSSIAESLARLPGLAGERKNGRVSGISVRGFKEDFIGSTLNGRELIGIGDNRGVEYDLYPSEIMTGAVVYKSAQANLVTQGIGGTVDLRTVRPLEAAPSITLNATFEQTGRKSDNPDYDESGNRFAFSIVDQFADDTIGVALAIATTESPSNSRDYNTWGGYSADDNGVYLPYGTPINARSKVLERDTISAIVQWAPSEQMEMTVDYLKVDFKDSGIYRGVWTPLNGGFVTSSTPGSVAGTGTGRIENVVMTMRQDPQIVDGTLDVFGVNMKYNVNDSWTVGFDVASSESSKEDTGAEAYAGLGRSQLYDGEYSAYDFVTTTDGFSLTPVAGTPGFTDFNTVKLAGPQAWGGSLFGVQNQYVSTLPTADGTSTIGFRNAQDGFQNSALFDESLSTYKLDATGEIDGGIFNKVNVGVAYSDRQKVKLNQGYFVTAPTYPSDAVIPEQYRAGYVDLSWAGLGEVVAYDAIGLYADNWYTKQDAFPLEPDRYGDTFVIDEQITTFFVQGDFETTLDGYRVFGNAGVQVVSTDQSSDGYIGVVQANGLINPTEVSLGASYSHVLPSFNVNVELDENQMVRASASKTISRARMDQMKASGFVKFDQNVDLMFYTDPNVRTPWSGFQGNPELRPLETNNFDVSYEYYFGEDGYVSATYFYKDITNWTKNSSTLTDFSDYYIPGFHGAIDVGGVYGPAGVFYGPGTLQGFADNFADGLSGSVDGQELTANVPLNVLTDTLDGFGVAATATFIDAKLDDGSTIPGQSDETFALTAYYTMGGFEVRVAGTKRGDFTTYERGGSNKIQAATRGGVTLVDAQVSYDFADSGVEYLEGLRVSLQGTNLTDEDEIDTNDEGFVIRRQQYGPTYMLNLNYSF